MGQSSVKQHLLLQDPQKSQPTDLRLWSEGITLEPLEIL